MNGVGGFVMDLIAISGCGIIETGAIEFLENPGEHERSPYFCRAMAGGSTLSSPWRRVQESVSSRLGSCICVSVYDQYVHHSKGVDSQSRICFSFGSVPSRGASAYRCAAAGG